MNKPFILCVLAALAAFGQSQTPLTITQSAGSATGELRMQERRTNGQDYVGIRAPQSVASSTVWTLPSADGTSGQCLQTDGSGQWGWAACIINGGNTTGATLTIGTNDAQTLSLETNNTSYLQISSTGVTTIAGNVIPSGTRSLGITGTEWDGIYAGTGVITSIIEPKVNGGAQNGDAAKRWSTTYTVDLDVSGTCTGCSGLPVVDTTSVIKGSADATKLVRFEVDGFTTGTTRTLTPQNNSYTIAGTDIAQTFTQTQTFNGSTALVLNGNITGDLLFTSANVYIVGNGTNYLNNIYSETFTTYGRVKPASGVTTADLGAATTPFRKLWIGDISFTGTMTPPSGTAFSGTKTVRASGGASDCTLTFSAGILTGGTC